MQINIVYEDETLLVVNKPNNMLVYNSYYARNIKDPSLIQQLKLHYSDKLYPVHRLDYKTSGLLLLTKTAISAKHIQQQFESNTIQKSYFALLRGYTPLHQTIDTPVKNPETGVYKEALTHLNTLYSFEIDIPVKPYPKSRYSLVKMTPQTGRMHQLRKHANKISHPIIGDHKYGNRHHNAMFENQLQLPNLFLHAHALNFIHPATTNKLSLTAPLPSFWQQMAHAFDFNLHNYVKC